MAVTLNPISITDGGGFRRLERRLNKIAGSNLDDLLDELGGLITDQTQIRIKDEKRAPRGRSWPPWSKKYKRTRHSGHSRLIGEGHLLQSIQHIVSFSGGVGSLEVGTNIRYASAHQFGIGVPMRRFLGLSPANVREVEEEMRDWVKKRLAA